MGRYFLLKYLYLEVYAMLTKVKTGYVRRIFKYTEDGKNYIIVDCDDCNPLCDPGLFGGCVPDQYCSPDWYGDTCGPDEEEHEY